MEARELRIGNLLRRLDDSVFNVTVHDLHIIHLWDSSEKLLPQPIPLTEDWLLKLGFVKRADCEFDFWENSMWKLKEYKNKKYYQLYHCSDEVDCTMIKFVHQIQNLFYAITGEELKII